MKFIIHFSRLRFLIVGLFCLVFVIFCDPDSNGNDSSGNPVPMAESLSPASLDTCIAFFTLSVKGNSFVPGATIIFNGVKTKTYFQDSTELTCQIHPDDFKAGPLQTLGNRDKRGMSGKSVSVIVQNPPPGGGDSNSLDFQVNTSFILSKPIKISTENELAYHLNIAVSGTEKIYAIWSIFWGFACLSSTDSGASWNGLRCDIDGDSWGISRSPVMTADSSGNIHVVWEWSHYIGYNHFEENSNTWGQPVAIIDGANPAIAVDGSGNIHVAGDREGLMFRRSQDKGATWGKTVTIYDPGSKYWITKTSMGVDSNGIIHVVWDEWFQKCILSSRSTDQGLTWSNPVNISKLDAPPEITRDPAIAADQMGNTYTVWHRSNWSSGEGDILYFSRLKANQKNWSPPKKMPDMDGSYPDIAVDNAGVIHVVSNGNQITHSRDMGASWSRPDFFSKRGGFLNHAKIFVDKDRKIYIIWNEHRFNFGDGDDYDDIFFTSGYVMD